LQLAHETIRPPAATVRPGEEGVGRGSSAIGESVSDALRRQDAPHVGGAEIAAHGVFDEQADAHSPLQWVNERRGIAAGIGGALHRSGGGPQPAVLTPRSTDASS
jgi:hypothetical protein